MTTQNGSVETEIGETESGLGAPASDLNVLALFRVKLGIDDSELEWQERALCSQTDPEVFFPEKGGTTRDAKSVCIGCPVRSECLEWALAHDERFGVWGGLSERERRKLKGARSDGSAVPAAS